MGGWGAWLGTGALRDSNEVSKLFVCHGGIADTLREFQKKIREDS
jgi:hypothetical protein